MEEYIKSISLTEYHKRGSLSLPRDLVNKLNDTCDLCLPNMKLLFEGAYLITLCEGVMLKLDNCYEFINVNIQVNGKTRFLCKYAGKDSIELLTMIYNKVKDIDMQELQTPITRYRDVLISDFTEFIGYRLKIANG